MSDRGEYRSIRRVLLDGPDFQKLPERARWAFVALKLSAGPTGIEIHYPESLSHQLSLQTGMPRRALAKALDVLEHAGWIRRESNVLWIVKHLTFDPHMSPKDRKHRMAVQRHMASMPRLAIVRQFIEEQPDWFPVEEATANGLGWAISDPNKGLGRAIEGPSKHNNENEDETEKEKENQKRTTTSAGRKKARPRVASERLAGPNWLGPSSKVWEARFGAGSFPWGEFGRHVKPISDKHPPATIAEHLQRYLERTDAQYVSSARFAKTFGEYGPTDPNALVDEWGVLTPYGEKETRPAGLKIA